MVNFPLPEVVDIRMPIVGDSFTWAGIEPTAAKKSIVIHGTASEAPQEDGFSMAEYHVNNNGWGGIGVHFVVTKDAYVGRAGATPPGVQVQYVGDLGTWRAGCLNQNPGRIHIEISGLFTGRTPSEAQLRKVRQLVDFMLAPNNILPSLNYYSQVTYHNAVPGQNTSCPGWAFAGFNEWFGYLQGGAEPSWFSTQQAPPPVIAPPVVVPPVVTPPPPITEPLPEPEYVTSFVPISGTATTIIAGFAVDMTGSGAPLPIEANVEITLAGRFTDNGRLYYRSAKSLATDAANHTYYGLSEDYFAPQPSGQPSNMDIPVTVVTKKPGHLWAVFASLLSPLLRLLGSKKTKA